MPHVPKSSEPSALRPGDVIGGKFALLRPLGVGSMGQVWVARNTATDAEVAVKLLLPERVGTEDASERFRREAHAMSRLSHRGIVRAFDLVDLDPERGSLLLVMELLHGQTLAQRLEQAGPRGLSIAETVQTILPILSALDHAHAAGIVHRDLKPDNVLLSIEPDGEILPKLVDFGVSKMRHAGALTRRGAVVGTPCYMSPEQARGEEVDARSDVFAAGIVLYECLSGSAPFGGDTLHETVRAVLETEPPALDDLPDDLSDVVARALAKGPEDRYATAGELASAIVAALPGLHATLRAVRSAPPGPTSVTLPPGVSRTTTTLFASPPRSRGPLILAAACAACVVAFGFAAARRSSTAPPGATSRSSATAPILVARDATTSAAVLAPPSPPPVASLPSSSARSTASQAPIASATRTTRPALDAGTTSGGAPPSATQAAPATLVRDPRF